MKVDSRSHSQTSAFKGRRGFRRILAATRYSLSGLASAWRSEAAFRQETLAAVVLVPLALWLARDAYQLGLLIGSLLVVLIVELLNSAVEALADALSTDHHPLLGRAKDMGSSAVMLSLVLAGTVWAVVIFKRLAG